MNKTPGFGIRDSGFAGRDSGLDQTSTSDELLEKAAAAKRASITLAQLSTDDKNDAVLAMARAIRANEAKILAANDRDCSAPDPKVELDRLRLTPERVAAMARDVEAVAD